MEKHTYFKYCLVPLCNSTTAKTPNKVFIRLPFDRNRRTKWLEACRKEVRDVSPNSSALHVCEDHFNLENDMENYLRWKLMGGHKLMKSDAVPHKFECQALKVVGKKKRIQETEDALSASTSINISTLENSSSNVNDTVEQPQQCEAVDSLQNTNLDTTNLSASSDSTESTDCEHDFGVNELKNKIKNIRSTYQQEVNKIRRSKQGFRGDILEEYKTNLAWFPIADRFLGTVINSTKNPLPKLEEDMENYVKFKLVGGIKKLKPNVVPHIFDCQLDVRLPTLSAESTTTSSKDDSSSIQMDQNNTIYSVQVLSDVNESPKQSTIAVMETCVKVRSEYMQAQIWLRACSREDLVDKLESLHSTSYRLCSGHFEEKMFLNNTHNRLHKDAVPRCFPQQEGSSQSANQQVPFAEGCGLSPDQEFGSLDEPRRYLQPSLAEESNVAQKTTGIQAQDSVLSDESDNSLTELPNVEVTAVLCTVQTQTSQVLSMHSPRKEVLRKKIKHLTNENYRLKQRIQKLSKSNTEEEDASFYHSNQPALYNLVETEMNGEIDSEIDVKYQPFTISLDQIKEEIDIDDYNSPSVTHQLKKRKSSHQSAYEAIDQTSRTESDTQIHNPMEDIQKDEWYHFGNNIACQLRNLSLERALMCQQKIIEILTQERIDFITKMKTEDTNTTKED